MINKPYAPACDRNRDAIFAEVEPYLRKHKKVFEIASGTGQHGVYFSDKMPELYWQMSDLEENHSGINAWVSDSQLSNVAVALALNVDQETWPILQPQDVIFTANALHIMGWSSVENFFRGIKQHLKKEGFLIIYGPFNYKGKYTSLSNADFDQWLKQQNQVSAIRDFESVDALAVAAGLRLHKDVTMPANNRLLIWQKVC